MVALGGRAPPDGDDVVRAEPHDGLGALIKRPLPPPPPRVLLGPSTTGGYTEKTASSESARRPSPEPARLAPDLELPASGTEK